MMIEALAMTSNSGPLGTGYVKTLFADTLRYIIVATVLESVS